MIFLYALLAMNVFTFIVYGYDKYKSRHKKWRTPESTLLLLAVFGGSMGAYLCMKTFHHETKHKKFVYGVPAIFLAQLVLLIYYYLN